MNKIWAIILVAFISIVIIYSILEIQSEGAEKFFSDLAAGFFLIGIIAAGFSRGGKKDGRYSSGYKDNIVPDSEFGVFGWCLVGFLFSVTVLLFL